MRNKHRKIKVGGVEYRYSIKMNCDGDGNLFLRVSTNKPLFVSKFSSEMKITPSIVRQEIEIYKKAK